MCRAALHRSPECGHHWFVLTAPCGPDKNFNTCPSFKDGRLRSERELNRAIVVSGGCPECDQKEDYDGAKIRMVEGVRRGWTRRRVGQGMFGTWDGSGDSGGRSGESVVICCVVI